MRLFIVSAFLAHCALGFFFFKSSMKPSMKIYSTTWQEDLDKFLDIDTPWESKRDILENGLQKIEDVSKDVVKAVEDGDISVLFPANLKYGKAVVGLQALRRQIIGDILPDLLTKAVPKAIESGPKLIQQAIEAVPEKSQELFATAKEISQDPSALQSTVDDLKKEVGNIFRSTPEGMYSPPYEVLKKTDDYEIRKYASYSVACTPIPSDEAASLFSKSDFDLLASGNAFCALADYVFGRNEEQKKIAFTTPFIIETSAMEFVLPEGLTAATAPNPNSTSITLRDVPSEIVAVREFPGLVTDGEVSRQRAKLEDGLLTDALLYDNLAFKVFQYNGPFTLLWLRRNEVSLKLIDYVPDQFVSKDASQFYSAPEAGD